MTIQEARAFFGEVVRYVTVTGFSLDRLRLVDTCKDGRLWFKKVGLDGNTLPGGFGIRPELISCLLTIRE